MKKKVNLITQENVKFTLFPDGQPHVDLTGIEEGDEVSVVCRLRYANDVLHLLEVSDAIDGLKAVKGTLDISYLMAARYDRSMRKGDSLDLRVIGKLINSCYFNKVLLFDVHSPKAMDYIYRAENCLNKVLVDEYKKRNSILIVPDEGAKRKAHLLQRWNGDLIDIAVCEKHRELDTGRITLRVLDPDKCEGKHCVIVDDICDGGGTFLAIASQIEPKSLTLIVTHGIFSKGLRLLLDNFDEIITTDSYQYQNPRKGLKVIRLYESNASN